VGQDPVAGLGGLVEGDLDDQDLAWAFPVVRTRREDHLEVDHNLLVEEGHLDLEDHMQWEDPDLAGRSRQEELDLEGNLWEEGHSPLEGDHPAWAGDRFEGAEDVAEVGGDRDLDPELGGRQEEDHHLQDLGHAEKRVRDDRWWMGWRKPRGAVGSSLRPSLFHR